jgi:hypothetical protein
MAAYAILALGVNVRCSKPRMTAKGRLPPDDSTKATKWVALDFSEAPLGCHPKKLQQYFPGSKMSILLKQGVCHAQSVGQTG